MRFLQVKIVPGSIFAGDTVHVNVNEIMFVSYNIRKNTAIIHFSPTAGDHLELQENYDLFVQELRRF